MRRLSWHIHSYSQMSSNISWSDFCSHSESVWIIYGQIIGKDSSLFRLFAQKHLSHYTIPSHPWFYNLDLSKKSINFFFDFDLAIRYSKCTFFQLNFYRKTPHSVRITFTPQLVIYFSYSLWFLSFLRF